MRRPLHRPAGVVAGFSVASPDPGVPELVHAGEQWIHPRYSIAWHEHPAPEWEIYLQVDGRSRWGWEGGGEVDLMPGGFYAAPPGARHALLVRPTGKHHFLYACIDIPSVLARMPELAHAWQPRGFVHRSGCEALEAPFRALIREIATDAPHRALALRSALDLTIVAASRLLARSESRVLLPAHPGVAAARELIERRPGERWRLADLARAAALSPSRFSELFTRDVGMPPHRFVLRCRIERAQQVLRDTDVAITDLALDLGFATSQHFAKTFRRVAGCSAQGWRRRHRG